jgi:hypothetical protein
VQQAGLLERYDSGVVGRGGPILKALAVSCEEVI